MPLTLIQPETWMTAALAPSPQKPPLVSVCIPSYQGAAHIGAAIASVLSQSLTDFELLVVDDCSSDSTIDIVTAFADPRIRLLRNPSNLGPEGNWNRCLTEARGRYIKLLPHDDSLALRCLEKQVAILESDPELALVFCSRQVIDASGRPLICRSYGRAKAGRIIGQEVIRRCLRHGTNLVGEPGAVLFRRATARQVGGFDGSLPYVIDLDYWVRLLAHGDAYYLPQPLAAFRVSSSSWSAALSQVQSSQFCRFIDQVAGPAGANMFEQVAGHAMARVNGMLRRLVYRLAKDAQS